MVLKRQGAGLIEIFGKGNVRFRPWKFSQALGTAIAEKYHQGLLQLIPHPMTMKYPFVAPDEAAKVASALHDLIEQVLANAENARTSGNVEA